MPAIVSVEIAPPETRDDLRRALLEACKRTVKDAECVENAPESAPPDFVAIVSWKDPEDVRLEVAIRAQQQWMTRDIHFAPEDPPEERWRAVGLVIGTLASVMAQESERAAVHAPPPVLEPEPPKTPPPVEPVEPPKPAKIPLRRGFVGVALVTGPGLDRGAFRLGGEAAGSLRLVSGLHGTLGFAYSRTVARLDGANTSFLEGFAGVAYDVDLGRRFSLVPRLEAFVHRIQSSVVGGAPDPTSGDRIIGGARLGADAYYWGLAPVGFFAGAAARVSAGPTDVQVGESVAGTVPVFGALLRAGIAIEFR